MLNSDIVSKIISIITLFVQGITTFAVMFSIYMGLVIFDYEGGIDAFVGTALFQPILGAILSILTIFICLIAGLPIRISKRIYRWWNRNYSLGIIGAIGGCILLVLSFLPDLRETVSTITDGQQSPKEVPNPIFAAVGWFLTAFSLLHIFPGANAIAWMEKNLFTLFGLGEYSSKE